MKKSLLLLSAALLFAGFAFSQTVVMFKPGPAAGEDVGIMTSYGCIMDDQVAPMETLNGDGSPELNYIDWTYNAGSCPHGTTRSLIRFTGLNSIPPGATIVNATLNLYGQTTNMGNWGNSTFPGSPYTSWGTNEGWLELVAGGWNENTVTWNTQPGVAAFPAAIPIPMSTSQWSYDVSFNVTAMVQQIVSSGVNNGFRVRLQNEAIYRQVLFASSDHPDATLWPELIIEYIGCDADFNYCTRARTPYSYTFTPSNPQPGDNYQWFVNGAFVSTSSPFNYNFPAPGTYDVCLQLFNQEQGYECRQCVKICVADNGNSPGNGDGGPDSDNPDGRIAPTGKINFTTLHPDTEAPHRLVVSPNPSHDGWKINVTVAGDTEADVLIYDLSGKLLSQTQRRLRNGINTLHEKGQDLKPGVYMLEIKGAGFSMKEKIEKN